jgi:hypothetical protein
MACSSNFIGLTHAASGELPFTEFDESVPEAAVAAVA